MTSYWYVDLRFRKGSYILTTPLWPLIFSVPFSGQVSASCFNLFGGCNIRYQFLGMILTVIFKIHSLCLKSRVCICFHSDGKCNPILYVYSSCSFDFWVCEKIDFRYKHLLDFGRSTSHLFYSVFSLTNDSEYNHFQRYCWLLTEYDKSFITFYMVKCVRKTFEGVRNLDFRMCWWLYIT